MHMSEFGAGVVSLFYGQGNPHTHYHGGLYTSLNPLRNNPLVEGVNTEAGNTQTTTTRTCGPRVDTIFSSVAVECNVDTHSKIY